MRSIKGSFVGLVMAGLLALVPTAAFAHGGGGGGHGGGGGGFGGGHGGGFGGGHSGGGHFAGSSHLTGGGHFAGFAQRSFAGRTYAQYRGSHFADYGNHFRSADHFRDRDHFRHHGGFFFGDSFGYDPYAYDYPYYGYDDYNDGDYSGGQYSSADVTLAQQTVVAVQKELAKLGYYHGPIDGLIGPETERAISWFQSVDKLTVTGQIDDATLKALQI
jgi:hypothetical protein